MILYAYCKTVGKAVKISEPMFEPCLDKDCNVCKNIREEVEKSIKQLKMDFDGI